MVDDRVEFGGVYGGRLGRLSPMATLAVKRMKMMMRMKILMMRTRTTLSNLDMVTLWIAITWGFA